MNGSIKIHETAFMTATYRATYEELSKDPYSRYWTNPKTDAWVEQYGEAVSPHEPFTHCLRNRFFYETINRLVANKEIEVLINFGCGFSMYPYLFGTDLMHIEIDQKDVIEYKKRTIKELQDAGKLPLRKVHYISKDFSLEKQELVDAIQSITQGRTSFVLLEGVIFFLNQKITEELFKLIAQVQTPGSYFGSVSFLDRIEETTCFKRLINFAERELILEGKFEYQTLPTSFYTSLPMYDLVEHEEYVSLSKKFSPANTIENGDEILNEQLYLLQRK
jgi:O-methyltransferase involved in polyketide biosynthesis